MIDELKQNKNFAQSFGINYIKRKKDRFYNSIAGAIVNRIHLNLSIDNYYCRQILNMDAGAAKQRRMQEFVDKTIRDAKNDLAEKIVMTMKQVTDEISEFMQDNLESQERQTERMEKKFERWEVDIQNKNFDRERAQLPALEKFLR